MCDVKNVLENLEKQKKKLILLNDIYDDVFKPWIEIELAPEVNNQTVPDSNEDDLSLLYKLQDVLIKASVAKELPPKPASRQKLQPKPQLKPQIKPSKFVKYEPHTKIEKNENHPSVRRKFIPAHRTAPFKTEPERKTVVRISSKKKPVEKSVCGSDENQETMEPLGAALNALQSELRVREEQFKAQEAIELIELTKPPILKITMELEAACRAGWSVVPELRRACRARARGLTKLARYQLQAVDTRLPRMGHNPPDTLSGPARSLWDSWQIVNMTSWLDKVICMTATLDLSACNITQIGFLRACMSLALKSLLVTEQLQQPQSSNHKAGSVSQKKTASSDTHDIRAWLAAKQPSSPTPDPDCVFLETAYLTNCPFVTALPTPRGQPISLAVKNIPLCPFRFVSAPGGDPLSSVSAVELTTRSMIVQQQLHQNWASLLGRWVSSFQQAKENGDRSAREYRNIYGLLTGMYPTVLKEFS